MGDSIRDGGLFTASARLAELANDSARLDRARERFGDSPPSYSSQPSGTTTRSHSLNPATEEAQRYEQRRVQLTLECRASLPREQWDAETIEEAHRIVQAGANDGTYLYVPDATALPPEEIIDQASEVVTRRWKAQGIWDEKWKEMHPQGSEVPCGPWKHERPLEINPESQARAGQLAFQHADKREASRPFHQFIYQVSAERERSREALRVQGPNEVDPANINTIAYEKVKGRWVKRGIWDRHWGILPGMNWKHEQDFQKILLEEAGPEPVATYERDGFEAQNGISKSAPFADGNFSAGRHARRATTTASSIWTRRIT
ncbi:uncharacterized protein PG986_003667 [Apiospora aurea]|uniref:Uncharacterized protein n=1 Tax=Apiospora aurea TaxID=335848 RepID=A0ABR1QSB2_9PEZI